MKIHYMFIAILVIGMIATGLTVFIGDLGTNYGETTDFSSLNESMNSMYKTQQESEQLAEDISGFKFTGTVADILYVPYQVMKAGIQFFRTIFKSFGTVLNIFGELSRALALQGIYIPGWLIGSVTAIFLSIIVYIAVTMFIKWKAED